jgi:hypothetical protein
MQQGLMHGKCEPPNPAGTAQAIDFPSRISPMWGRCELGDRRINGSAAEYQGA